MKKSLLLAGIGVGAALLYAQMTPVESAPLRGDSSRSAREKFDPSANPQRDLQAALLAAKKQNKRVILDVGGEWCSWCREMDNFLAREPELRQLRDHNYVWVKVNFSDENLNRDFLAKYPKISGYPHLFVLENNGKLLFSKNTEELEDGKSSYNRQKFAAFLTRYAPPKPKAK